MDAASSFRQPRLGSKAREAHEARDLGDLVRDVVNHIVPHGVAKDSESNLLGGGGVDRVEDGLLLRMLDEETHDAFGGFINDLIGGTDRFLLPGKGIRMR